MCACVSVCVCVCSHTHTTCLQSFITLGHLILPWLVRIKSWAGLTTVMPVNDVKQRIDHIQNMVQSPSRAEEDVHRTTETS